VNWKQEYDIGIKEIDDQHRDIVHCISDIEQAVARQEQWSGVHWGMVNLENLSQVHFKVEESLMRIHGYRHLDDHASDHARFLLLLKELQQRALAGRISQERIYALHEWWDEHIQKHDQPYAARFLAFAASSKA